MKTTGSGGFFMGFVGGDRENEVSDCVVMISEG
jgi:hypothetical protein